MTDDLRLVEETETEVIVEAEDCGRISFLKCPKCDMSTDFSVSFNRETEEWDVMCMECKTMMILQPDGSVLRDEEADE
jgi:hypothetical protein